jgi:hypothetical protein
MTFKKLNIFNENLFVELGNNRGCIPILNFMPFIFCTGEASSIVFNAWIKAWRNKK